MPRRFQLHFAIPLMLLAIAKQTVAAPAVELASVHRDHERAVLALAFSPDGRLLATGGEDERLIVYPLEVATEDPAVAQLRTRLLGELDDARFVVRQAAHEGLARMGPEAVPDFERCLATTESTEVRLRIQRLLDRHRQPSGVGHTGAIRDVAFSPDGTIIATAGHDDSVFLWHASTVKAFQVIRAHADGIWSLAFVKDGNTLVTGGGDNRINAWDVHAYQRRRTLEHHASNIQSLAISSDGKWLASAGGFDQSVAIWNVASGELHQVLTPNVGTVLAVAFHPEETKLAISGYGSHVVIYDLDAKTEVVRHSLDFAVIRSLDFSRDGNWLAAAGRSDTVVVLPWERDAEPARLTGHTDVVHAVRFGPNDLVIATADDVGAVRLWRFDAKAGGKK